jgi:signal transduction histidine kinase
MGFWAEVLNDSTLMILQHRLKAQDARPKIQVMKEYAALPKIDCYPGQINQVLMSLLSNAIDALEEAEVVSSPMITIRTKASDRAIQITIADNGVGMTEAVKSRIFDPFFTTKSVGKGTGLGLYSSYKTIAEQHGGKLFCHSAPGAGAEFAIELPLQPI